MMTEQRENVESDYNQSKYALHDMHIFFKMEKARDMTIYYNQIKYTILVRYNIVENVESNIHKSNCMTNTLILHSLIC